MKFRNQLKVRDFKGTTIQLITRKLNQQGNFEQASAIQWVSREVVSFGDINKDKVELVKYRYYNSYSNVFILRKLV